ncbi:MAG TPA: hypothetical protein VKQ32_14190 [Polyangia bacterium]|nr:hypothetical protein [Polyangia bacterium]
MPNAPLSDWEKQQVQKYLREDKDFTRAALWAIFGSAAVVNVVCMVLTQPWPSRGPGGGNVPGGFSGPFITEVATLATVLILAKLLKRKRPQHAPRLGGDQPPDAPPAERP